VRTKPESCAGCPCYSHGTDFTQPEGLGSLGVLVVAEASGESEAREGLPLRPYAPAGSLFQRALNRLSFNREQFTLTNILRCHPRNNFLDGAPWEQGAIQQCRPNLSAVVEKVKPRVILTLGNIPLRDLTGHAGKSRTVSHLRGYAHAALGADLGNAVVFSTYHPSFIRRGAAHLTGVFMRDIQRAVMIANGRDKSYLLNEYEQHCEGKGTLKYQTHPSYEDARAFYNYLRDNPQVHFTYDLETVETPDLDEDAREQFADTQVRTIQFSHTPGTGICLPWSNGYRQIASDILQLPNVKIGHNCFAQHTSVWMADGSWKPIWKIKSGERVRSVSPNGKLIDCRVAEGFKTRDDREWVEVRVDGAHNRGVGKWGNRGVICTPDHEWYRPDGSKVTAEFLRPGDAVVVPRQGAFDLITGCLNGDGYIDSKGCFRISHTNQGWAEAKAAAFGVQTAEYKTTSGYKLDTTFWAVQLYMARQWRSRHYDGTQKMFVPGNHRMLAILYGDDGCLASKQKKNKTARIALHKFMPQLEWIKDWFSEQFGKCSLQNEAVLALSVEASKVFFKMIAPYLHPSMDYKLPEEFRGRYEGWMERPEPQIGWVEAIVPAKPKQYNTRDKYCLVVEESHNFFTRAGLVSNCWLFDDKVLKACGEREGFNLVPKGFSQDTLQMFHHWQPDLPAHLQYAASFVQFPFPWKHLSGTNLEFYGIADVDATLRLYNEAKRTMQARGIWDGYVSSVYEVRPVLAKIEDRGLPIDDQERLKLDGEFEKAQSELQAELDARFPDEARSIHPKEGYKKLPKDTTGMVERKFQVADLDAEGNPISTNVNRWCRLEPFSPNSSPQLLRYMKAKKHPTPKDKKKAEANGDQGETTAKKELVRLASKTGDDFYLKVIECREFGKMRGTYIEGFKPLSDGRVHATITFDTATWQLAAKNPNIMNFPVRGRLAKIVRKMVAAPEGHTIVEFDFKSFHVLTTGFFAESANYMRLARLDMHSFVAGHFAKCWDAAKLFSEPDEELLAKFEWFKSDPARKAIRDSKAKPSILGIGFGLGVNKLYDMNRESFSSLKEAKMLRETIEHLFPEVFQWQKKVQQQAHDQTYLRSPHGGIRWFYDVFQWNSQRRQWVGGDQAEQALAFLPANSAFGHIRGCLKELEDRGYAEKYQLVNNIHDAVSFIVRDEEVESCLRDVYPVLTAPSKILINKVAPNGLWCDVDGKAGKNWSEMKGKTMPKVMVVSA
jgi:uracil-DNA glycosylase family 4